MNNWHRIFVLLATLVPFGAAANPMVTEVVPLNNRLVDDILPIVKPLVVEGGTVTGMNSQLIVRTTSENLAEIKGIIASLDTRLRNLRISVRQDVDTARRGAEDALAARVRSGDVSAQVGGPGTFGPGASVQIGGDDGAVRYRTLRTESQEQQHNTHFVRTVEGRPAYIHVGQSIPQVYGSTTFTPFGAFSQQGIDYREVGSGFYVTPRLTAAGSVQLEVSPYADRPGAGGNIEVRGLNTVVNGRLGEWIPLGGSADSARDDRQGTLFSTRDRRDDSYDVWVKVEEIP
ncbi:MAG: hypothetical protein AAF384_17215 [Pseudomonadota bacterium]